MGISLPHGAFDGTGAGQIHRALEADLLGREWDAPATVAGNALDDAFENLAANTEVEEVQASAEVAPSPAAGQGDVQPTTSLPLVFKTLYLGDTVVERIKISASNELRASHPGVYVSSGDVLVAWITKVRSSVQFQGLLLS